MILKHGRIIDPKNSIDMIGDLQVKDNIIISYNSAISPAKGEQVIDCTDQIIMPGIIDMHLHLGDLFDVNESPVKKASCDGVTTGFTPGAGNTYMAPALLGAEVDRGLPINAGVYLGAPSVIGSSLSEQEVISLFQGDLDESVASNRLSHNPIVCRTAHMAMGIKDHMGHFVLTDAMIDSIYNITTAAGLVFMSHTQDPAHSERLVSLSHGRALHLGHASAAGCGTHDDGLSGFTRILNLVDGDMVTAELVSSMMLPCRGRRDGLLMDERARQAALQALSDKKVDILVSDGQSASTMKGFGNTSDNLPAIFYLADTHVLSLSDAIATMTYNPARLIYRRTHCELFDNCYGTLQPGAFANITVANPLSARATFTIVQGHVAAIDGALVPVGACHGHFVYHDGDTANTGVGDLPIYL